MSGLTALRREGPGTREITQSWSEQVTVEFSLGKRVEGGEEGPWEEASGREMLPGLQRRGYI